MLGQRDIRICMSMSRPLLLGLLLELGGVCFCSAQSTSDKPREVAPAPSLAQAASQGTPTKAATSMSPPSSATARSDGPAIAPNPLGEALVLYRKGEFNAAIEKYQQILQDRPKSPDAYAGLVRVYLKQKNVELAAQAAAKGLAQTDSTRIHVARGEVRFREGRIDEAEKEWVDVVNSGFPEARAYLGIARVLAARAMYLSAKKMIEKAHQLDPNDPDIQEYWVGTLPRAERIKYLENSLAGENNRDATEREDLKNYLEYLKEQGKQNRGSCRLVSKVSVTETPLVLSPSVKVGLSVVLNGRKSLLLLDTGASGILVKRSIAEHAGISKIAETKVGGIGDKGRKKGFIGIADSIKIGDLEFQHCPVEVLESRSVAGDDGLIGADVFQGFLVDIDVPDGKLKLSQLPGRPGETQQKLSLKAEEDADDSGAPEKSDRSSDGSEDGSARSSPPTTSSGLQDRYIAPEMQSYTKVFRFGHNLLVPTIIGNVPSKLFLMDTGASTNFISPAAAREVTKVKGDYDTTIEGISGKVNKTYTAEKAVLQFGHLRQENQEMTALDTTSVSDSVGTEVSGFLGFSMLMFLDIKIDYRDALVDFNYNPKRQKK
jgi:tetratricopeptide (TPR) repeat protein